MGEAFWDDCGSRSGARTLVQLGDIREEERGIFFFLGREGLCTYVEELMWQVRLEFGCG